MLSITKKFLLHIPHQIDSGTFDFKLLIFEIFP